MVQFIFREILDKVFRKRLLAHVKADKVILMFFIFESHICYPSFSRFTEPKVPADKGPLS